MIFPITPIADAVAKTRQAEALGFDELVLPDHIGDPRSLAGPWHAGWSLLAVVATVTRPDPREHAGG